LREVTIRRATRRDSFGFLDLLVGLAKFERLPPPTSAGKLRIIEDIFAKRKGRLFLAIAGKRPVGYALYFFTYSTFLAKPTLYLEDIFVLEQFRKRGIGQALFMKCVEEAARNGCGRFELSVLTWNMNAIKFYEKLGAKRLKEWYSYRMTEETLRKLRMTVQSPKRTFPRA
jgi:GNAT superfamily N-acetyltransferase